MNNISPAHQNHKDYIQKHRLNGFCLELQRISSEVLEACLASDNFAETYFVDLLEIRLAPHHNSSELLIKPVL